MEDKNLKRYYSISEVADLLSLQASQIRFWEKEFDTLKPAKDSKGNRRFTAADIEVLRSIRYLLKERGMTIDGARPLLKSALQETQKKEQAIANLKVLKRFLITMRDRMEEQDFPELKKESKPTPQPQKYIQPTLF